MGWADSVFAIGIAIFLAYGAVRIGWDAFQSLMDRELPEAEKQQILATIKAVRGCWACTIYALAKPAKFVLYNAI